jgi:putative membrane protein
LPDVPIPTPARQVARGFAMGAADIVPGVSGGTVALVLGIYERLIHNVREGARALRNALTGDVAGFATAMRRVEWVWLVSLLVGILSAVAVLSSILEQLLHDHPVRMAALFFGLVAGSLTVAWRLIGRVGAREVAVVAVVAIALFLLLGLRSDTEVAEGTAEIVTRSWWIFFLSGALAICAMILPGISGSFILVMIGMYTEVLGAVNDRDLVALAATAAGCVVGLALFSTVLNWSLEHHHDLVMAAMVGLMLGSLRVLWPWPTGTRTTDLAWPADDVVVPVLLAIGGVALVLVVELVASRTTRLEAATATV